MLARYPASSDTEAAGVAARLITDFKIATLAVRMARGMSISAPVYVYRFSRASPANRSAYGGAAHASDLPYMFGTLAPEPGRNEARDEALAQEMADAWAQFVKTGNPNPSGSTRWPAFKASDERLMDFGDATAPALAPSAVADFFAAKPVLPET